MEQEARCPFCPRSPAGRTRGGGKKRGLTTYALLHIYTIMQTDAFLALADPTRRRIVDALRSGEQQVNDIVEQSRIHQSGVSRHLRILREAGFVSMRPDGQRRLYSLRPEPFQALEGWLATYQRLWEARLDRFGAALEKRQRRRKSTNKETRT